MHVGPGASQKHRDVQLNRFKCNISKKAITHGRDTFTKIKEQSTDASDAPSAPSLGISLLSVGVGIFIKIKKKKRKLPLPPLSSPLELQRLELGSRLSHYPNENSISLQHLHPHRSLSTVLRHMHLFIYGSPSSI